MLRYVMNRLATSRRFCRRDRWWSSSLAGVRVVDTPTRCASSASRNRRRRSLSCRPGLRRLILNTKPRPLSSRSISCLYLFADFPFQSRFLPPPVSSRSLSVDFSYLSASLCDSFLIVFLIMSMHIGIYGSFFLGR